MEKVMENLTNLLKIKSIISLIVVIGLTYGFFVDKIDGATYVGFGMSIVTYYFNKADSVKEGGN